ncbi:MAG: hypothetical protein HZA64_00550 [Rhodocyclales bacterium]|nr:hypothetical protein [Rhodocyclales bacterium]
MKPAGLRKMTFVHWLLIALVVAYIADWLVQRPDGRAREINAVIDAKGSEALRNYPYKFRVVRVGSDTAVLSTPRNVSVPAFRFLGVIHPEIDVKNANDPAFIAAEKELAAVQTEVMNLARAQQGIKGVQWELDRAWLARHGIDVPN